MSNVSNSIGLTRKELSRFLPDDKSIRAFEKLFKVVPEATNQNETVSSESRSVQATDTAQEALKITKGANVLLWLSM